LWMESGSKPAGVERSTAGLENRLPLGEHGLPHWKNRLP
jgi:hypothetical protein